jgi:hypothetical protein
VVNTVCGPSHPDERLLESIGRNGELLFFHDLLSVWRGNGDGYLETTSASRNPYNRWVCITSTIAENRVEHHSDPQLSAHDVTILCELRRE